MSQALQRIEHGAIAQHDPMAEWQVIREQASVLLSSGFLPASIKSPEAAMAIILTGRELGIGPMAALNSINIIQGKPTLSPQLMLAMANGTGQVEDVKIDTGTDGAIVTVKRRGRSPYTTTFGPKEAKAMGLDGKDNYKKQAATMYQWRAVAANLRITFPDVIMGMYTPDEMGATVTSDGEIVEGFNAPPLTVVKSASGDDANFRTYRGELLDKMKSLFIANGKTVTEWEAYESSNLTKLTLDALKSRLDAWEKAAADRAAQNAQANQAPKPTAQNVLLERIEQEFVALDKLGVSKTEQDALVMKVTNGEALDSCDEETLKQVVMALTAATREAKETKEGAAA